MAVIQTSFAEWCEIVQKFVLVVCWNGLSIQDLQLKEFSEMDFYHFQQNERSWRIYRFSQWIAHNFRRAGGLGVKKTIPDDCINWLKTDIERKWCISIIVFITYPFYNITISWII